MGVGKPHSVSSVTVTPGPLLQIPDGLHGYVFMFGLFFIFI